MPAGDRTGPLGLGPMTGRAAGYCAGYPVPGYMNPIPGRGWFGVGRGGYPWGGGRGRVWGGGRGWWWRARWFGGYPPYYAAPVPVYPYNPQLTPQEETTLLKEHIAFLEEQIKVAQERIKELETQKKETKSDK